MSAAGDVWRRLGAADTINQAFILAALLMLCVFPFLMLVAAVKGAEFVDNVSRHLALSDAAAADVGTLFGPASATLAATTVISAIWIVLASSGAASIIQDFYVKVFAVDLGGAKGVWRWPTWVAVAVTASSAVFTVSHWLEDAPGGSVLVVVVELAAHAAFWWWTLHFLLAGKKTWRYLLPAALATTLFWVGLRVASAVGFSPAMVSNEDKYGPIGVVFVLISWMIAVGVVIFLGAVVGVVWQERRAPGRPASA